MFFFVEVVAIKAHIVKKKIYIVKRSAIVKYEWNKMKKKEQQQHMQADLYIFVPLLLPKKFSFCCLTRTHSIVYTYYERGHIHKKSFENADSQKCVIQPQLHFSVCYFLVNKYIFVIGSMAYIFG